VLPWPLLLLLLLLTLLATGWLVAQQGAEVCLAPSCSGGWATQPLLRTVAGVTDNERAAVQLKKLQPAAATIADTLLLLQMLLLLLLLVRVFLYCCCSFTA
jgi:hypothetical protein